MDQSSFPDDPSASAVLGLQRALDLHLPLRLSILSPHLIYMIAQSVFLGSLLSSLQAHCRQTSVLDSSYLALCVCVYPALMLHNVMVQPQLVFHALHLFRVAVKPVESRVTM